MSPRLLLLLLGMEFVFSSKSKILSLKARDFVQTLIDKPLHNSGKILLSEPGYHWCPDWADGSWCPEGYLCGDGNNDCDYGKCCNDDTAVITCPTTSSNRESDLTPCSGNATKADGSYHCCDIHQICGDGTACTLNCAKGQCCDFDPSKTAEGCGYRDKFLEEECPVGVSDLCCASPEGWDLDENKMVDEAWADYYKSNDECWNGDVVNQEGNHVYVDCNYALGSYEYVCEHENGAICSLTLELTEYIPDQEQVAFRIDFTFYHCIAMECDNDPDEDHIELYLEQRFFNWTESMDFDNVDLTVDCSSLPCDCDASAHGGALSYRCDDSGHCDCKPNWTGDTCKECHLGYMPGNCTVCADGYHETDGICCPQYTENVNGHCKDLSNCLGVKMHLASAEDYCTSMFRQPCTTDTPLDTCGECQDGHSTGPTVKDGPLNTVCYPKKMIVDSEKVAEAKDGLDTVGIVMLTMFCTIISIAIGLFVWYKLAKKKKVSKEVKAFYKSAGKRLVEEDPSGDPHGSGSEPPPQQELVSVEQGTASLMVSDNPSDRV